LTPHEYHRQCIPALAAHRRRPAAAATGAGPDATRASASKLSASRPSIPSATRASLPAGHGRRPGGMAMLRCGLTHPMTTGMHRMPDQGDRPMNLSLSIGPLVALIAGILILIMPRLLNFIVALYLIIIGVIGLLGIGSIHFR
jgi:hypothetical protein